MKNYFLNLEFNNAVERDQELFDAKNHFHPPF